MHKQPTRIMDFAPAKRPSARPATATSPARTATPSQPVRQPAHARAPQRPRMASAGVQAPSHTQAAARPQPLARPRVGAQPQPRPASFSRPTAAATDPLSARPLSRPANHIAKRPLATSGRPATRIVQSTTVKSVAATADRVESFEFGVIEDLSPVVKPEPPMIPGSRPAPSAQPSTTKREPATDNYLDMRPMAAALAAEQAEQSKQKSSLFSRKGKGSDSTPHKSPFLSSVNVPKRPLSASAPTGVHVPVTPQASPEPAGRPPKKKRKNAPFIVIVILSVLLGVALGAIVYFVLPH